MPRAALALALLAVLASVGCRSGRSANERQGARAASDVQAVGWRKLGSWAGHGNLQTPSFETVTGQLRVRWRASRPAGSAGGSFELAAKSAISGRVLQVAVDRTGPGEGTAYVSQDPHDMYMEVESTNLDWSFTVEEAIAGFVQPIPSGAAR